MGLRTEQWTKLEVNVALEAPRSTYRTDMLFVSPGGLFIPGEMKLEPHTQVKISFSVEDSPVVAHAEVRRLLNPPDVSARGIHYDKSGAEMRIMRMEGDGAHILAEHIRKLVMESGGPG